MSKKKKKYSPLSKLINFPNTIMTFMREARDELKKVTWPTRQTTTKYTIVVIIASLSVGLVIGGIDYLLQLGLESII